MKLRVWGVRGSQASPGPDTTRYGGNTSCFDVLRDGAQSLLVLDAGTGLRVLGTNLTAIDRVDILLTHLHMDHIQGLGFFGPLHRPGMEVHLWGPASTELSLGERLSRYMSPPLFPVRLRDLSCDLHVHDVGFEPFEIPGARVSADLVCHPGPTVGYRIEADGAVLTYLPDHEPRLGAHDFPHDRAWTSGHDLASGADLLLHDAQYQHEEYVSRVGWGHSTASDALAFAVAAEVKRLMLIHHDPAHDDDELDRWHARIAAAAPPAVDVIGGREGDVVDV